MRNLLLTLLLLSSTQALAEVRLPKLISDHMVLQRDIAVPVWGWADEGEGVLVKLDGRIVGKSITQNGKWQVKLSPQAASGPHRLEIIGNNTITLQDIYFGDVWVASGQSNMELPMYRVAEDYPADFADADYPLIRQFKVPQIYNFKAPQDDFQSGAWVKVSPDTIAGVSAVALYFAKALHQHNKVAVGILNNALGGSPVEAWLSEEALQAFPESLAEAQRFKDDELIASIIAADQAKNSQWYGDITSNDAGLNGPVPWYAPELDDSDWQNFAIPGYRPLAEGEKFNGVWWLRKTVSLTAEQARQANIIRMGRIVDADEVYINGTKVGNTTYQYPPRRYNIPAGLLHAGDNQITVRVIANSGRSGFFFDKPYWIGTDAEHIELAGNWKAKVATLAPPLGGDTFIRWKPLGLYNGLTAPLTHYPIKGVIWYQGESNAGRWQDYHAEFSAMIKDWRAKWGQGDFPFIFAQLANFMQQHAEPGDSGWARLRQAQTETLSEPNTAMALAIDIGEWNDIHPTNKRTLGQRMALAARALGLGESVVYQGPELRSAKRQGQQVVLSFAHAQGLHLKALPHSGFAIADENGKWFWAKAKVEGEQIIVSHPEVNKPTKVSYAWADNPDAALYNGAQLPAVPFWRELSE